MHSDWVVFASIFVRNLGKKLAAGIDLSHHEVKSAFKGGIYEYQYHKDSGKEKLNRDEEVGTCSSTTEIISIMLTHATHMEAR